jgi:hypothetical protein
MCCHSLSISLSLAHTYTLSLFLLHTLTLYLSFSCTHSHSISLSLAHTHTESLSLSYSYYSDILLYSEERIDKTFKLHRRIELTTCSVADKCHTADEPNAFSVSSTEKSFVCCAGDLTSKNAWLSLLQETITSCKEQVCVEHTLYLSLLSLSYTHSH